MINLLRDGAINADQTLIENVLKKKYQSKPECKMAARLAAGATIADVLDGDDTQNKSKATFFLDFFNEIALMTCVGMKSWQIVLYYLIMLVLFVKIILVIKGIIPSSLLESCNICSGPRGSQSCRKGTKEECGAIVKWIAILIGFVVGVILLMIVKSVFRFVLKLMVYKLSALVAEAAVRAIV